LRDHAVSTERREGFIRKLERDGARGLWFRVESVGFGVQGSGFRF
jgi:hypothetical protein